MKQCYRCEKVLFALTAFKDESKRDICGDCLREQYTPSKKTQSRVIKID
jgi:hypothetical protein